MLMFLKDFYPCLTAGLSYYMSMKRFGVDAGRIQMLKANYEECLARAMQEDRKSFNACCAKTKVYLMASTKNALAMCDVCGFVYPHRI